MERNNMSYAKNIADYLLIFRRWNHLTQSDCGEMIGHSFQQWQKYEKGTNEMKAAKLLECARKFNNKSYLFDMNAVMTLTPAQYLEKLGTQHNYPPLYHILRKKLSLDSASVSSSNEGIK